VVTSVWIERTVTELCARHGVAAAPVVPFRDGSNLVAAVGERHVVKLFPRAHRHHWESERRVLPRFRDALPVEVPELLAAGEHDDGWRYVIITRVAGDSLEAVWPRLARDEREAVLAQLGDVMAAAHAQPVAELEQLPPRWADFVTAQRARSREHHARLGMPAWFHRDLDALLDAADPWLASLAPTAILTGEYTPFNLLVDGARLTGMIDFGDAMIGPREYDLLGPSLFLAAGDGGLLRTLFAHARGPSWPLEPEVRRGLLALFVLHRYSNPDTQLRLAAWRDRARSMDDLGRMIWPDA
jgi:hygromycin-B 7''-O-kinase